MDKKELIDTILYQRCSGGDTCAETAENYVDDVFEVDDELHRAMRDVNESIGRMIGRLSELNDELGFTYTDI